MTVLHICLFSVYFSKYQNCSKDMKSYLLLVTPILAAVDSHFTHFGTMAAVRRLVFVNKIK